MRLPGMAGGTGVPGDLLVTLRIPHARTHGGRSQTWARPPAGRDAYHRSSARPHNRAAGGPGVVPPDFDAHATGRPEGGRASAPSADVIELEVPVTVMEAIRGGVVEIQTPIGSRKVNLPPGCGGRTLKIRTRSRTGQVADTTFVLKLKVVLPTELDAEALHALEVLERAYRRPLPR